MTLALFTFLYYGFTFCFRIRIKYCQNKYHKKKLRFESKIWWEIFQIWWQNAVLPVTNNFTKKTCFTDTCSKKLVDSWNIMKQKSVLHPSRNFKFKLLADQSPSKCWGKCSRSIIKAKSRRAILHHSSLRLKLL